MIFILTRTGAPHMADKTPTALGPPFFFEWPVDQDGYKIRTREPQPPSPGNLALSLLSGPVHHLEPKGGPIHYYRPLEKCPALFRDFASSDDSAEAALRFSAQYGLLFEGHGDTLGVWIDQRRNLRRFVDMLDQCQRTGRSFLELIPIYNESVAPQMTIRIEPQPGKRQPAIQVVPTTLLSAMWLQAMTPITKGQAYRQCKNCGAWFPYGPPAGGRKGKTFCSNRCRVAWTRANERSNAK
jgi:hypothetical protein